MESTPNATEIVSQWDGETAPTDPLAQLIYASNLLGSDARITNFGGGNTSSKIESIDPLTGEKVQVLWVKASGGDLGSATQKNFASLYQAKLMNLEERYRALNLHEDDVVPLYPQCAFNLNPAAPSIDTPLHAFVPHPVVSHLHSDSVIAIAASKDCKQLTEEAFAGEMGWLPWKRPGFELGLMLRDLIREKPHLKGAMMESHGFICWADNWREGYELSLKLINDATRFIRSRSGKVHAFGEVIQPKSAVAPNLKHLLPVLRRNATFNQPRLIANLDQSESVLEFLGRSESRRLARLGTSCPDHFLRTKIRPLFINPDATDTEIESAFGTFREEYTAYYDRCKAKDSPPMRNPNPSIVLIPSVGLVSFGKNAQEAKVTGEFFKNAIAVMKGAETVSTYVALPEQEAFNIEYWQLEEAKLKRLPPEKELARQVAVISGGASGIGLATAKKMAALGAQIVLLDINESSLHSAVQAVEAHTVLGGVIGVRCDVTDSKSLEAGFTAAVLKFGGVDIVVANAGNARRGSVADTSPQDYQFLSNLLMKGYFDTLAEATRIMVPQGTGGSIIVVGSKNGVAAGNNAALYSAAKAFELHLMRVTAADFAKHKIRCNAINPDGVVTDSAIWTDAWKQQTAEALGISPDELVEYYAKRSLLGTVVTPDDCAEAICWLGSEHRSSRTTGCVITVDGGNKEGFLR